MLALDAISVADERVAPLIQSKARLVAGGRAMAEGREGLQIDSVGHATDQVMVFESGRVRWATTGRQVSTADQLPPDDAGSGGCWACLFREHWPRFPSPSSDVKPNGRPTGELFGLTGLISFSGMDVCH